MVLAVSPPNVTVLICIVPVISWSWAILRIVPNTAQNFKTKSCQRCARYLRLLYIYNDPRTQWNTQARIRMLVKVCSYLFPPSTLLVTSKPAHRNRKAVLLRPHIVAIWGPFTAGGQRQRERERERDWKPLLRHITQWPAVNQYISSQQDQKWTCRCAKNANSYCGGLFLERCGFWFCFLTSLTDPLTAHESNQMALPHALGHHILLDTRTPQRFHIIILNDVSHWQRHTLHPN